MLSNKNIILDTVKKVARALGEWNERAVFVGGAIVFFYADDPGAGEIRPTKDIDIFFEISTFSDLEEMQRSIIVKGFRHDTESKVVCRFLFQDIKVDIMSTKNISWAPSNQWFAPGLKNTISYPIDDISIKILSMPYFLASKVAAYEQRGSDDPRTSHDFEDIVYILDSRLNIGKEINDSDELVKNYLTKWLSNVFEDESTYKEAIFCHLPTAMQKERYNIIYKKIAILFD